MGLGCLLTLLAFLVLLLAKAATLVPRKDSVKCKTEREVLIEALVNLGSTGLVAFFLWLVLHNQIKNVERRVDDVDKAVTKLTDEHNGLAREFSELRGVIRTAMGATGETGRVFPFERKPNDPDRAS